jgi:hypothetical protein
MDLRKTIQKVRDLRDDAQIDEQLANDILECFRMLAGVGAPFICGGSEEKDAMGLPSTLLVCPAYGLDGFAIYKKTSDYSAPSW